MITLPPKTHIWIAAGVTDLRRGFDGLSALVQSKLEQSPFSGHVFVFRGRRGDLIKLLWWDGDGLLSVRQAPGTWPFRVAASDGRQRGAEPGAAIDVARRHRLAASRTHGRATVGDLSSPYFLCTDFYEFDSMRGGAVMAYCARGCLACIAPQPGSARRRRIEGADSFSARAVGLPSR